MVSSRSDRRPPWKGGQYRPREDDDVPFLNSRYDDTSNEESNSDDTSENDHLQCVSI